MDPDNPYSPAPTTVAARPSASTGTHPLAMLLLMIQALLWLFALRGAGIILWHVLRPLYYLHVAGLEVGIPAGYFSRGTILPALTALAAAAAALGLGRLRAMLRRSAQRSFTR